MILLRKTVSAMISIWPFNEYRFLTGAFLLPAMYQGFLYALTYNA